MAPPSPQLPARAPAPAARAPPSAKPAAKRPANASSAGSKGKRAAAAAAAARPSSSALSSSSSSSPPPPANEDKPLRGKSPAKSYSAARESRASAKSAAASTTASASPASSQFRKSGSQSAAFFQRRASFKSAQTLRNSQLAKHLSAASQRTLVAEHPPKSPVAVSIKDLTPSERNLMDACRSGDIDQVYKCIWDKVDLNCRIPYYGTTPLSLAFRNGHKMVCNVLIQFGAKSDPDDYGVTPLHWAAYNNQSTLIRDQVERGHVLRSDLSKRDLFGSTPLHFASVNNLAEMVKTLVDCGANSLVENNSGKLASEITASEKIKLASGTDAQRADLEMQARAEDEQRQNLRRLAELTISPKSRKKTKQPKAIAAPGSAPNKQSNPEPQPSQNPFASAGDGRRKSAQQLPRLPSAAKHMLRTRASNAWTAA
ncbi:Ankyrin repeat domain-containing protein 17 [Entophlyctis luteolus]|nr:Ankyrin repeat domain-containing protein 17 [Entophlyctis luteolus]